MLAPKISMDAGQGSEILKLVKDYLLEVSLDPGSNKIILSAFKRSLFSIDREICGAFVWDDASQLSFHFLQFDNQNTYDNQSFSVNSSEFYNAYVNGLIICLFHSHITDDPSPSMLDIETAKSFNLPSFIFANLSKETFLFYPELYTPSKLEGRIFIPYIQDCVTLVKDFFLSSLNINLALSIINWSRPKHNPNSYLLDSLNSCFTSVNINEITTNDIIVFHPTVGNLFHLGVVSESNYILHHPYEGRSRKELFKQMSPNQVYKVYRYKDL